MKLTQSDNLKLRAALSACRLANIDLAVITEGKIRGMSDSRTAVIFSDIEMSFEEDVKWGITRLGELSKRLELFGDNILIEGELNNDKKVKKISIKGDKANGKIDFRCTDIALLDRKYPKTHNEQEAVTITLKREDVSMLTKGVRTLGAERVTIQVKRDGQVHIESVDSSNDRFEFDLSTPAEFINEPTGYVSQYDTSKTGVLLDLLSHLVRDNDEATITMNESGNLGLMINGYYILAIPCIDI